MISSPLQSINLSISEIGASANHSISPRPKKSLSHRSNICSSFFFQRRKPMSHLSAKKRGLTVTLFTLSTVQLDISLEVYLLLNSRLAGTNPSFLLEGYRANLNFSSCHYEFFSRGIGCWKSHKRSALKSRALQLRTQQYKMLSGGRHPLLGQCYFLHLGKTNIVLLEGFFKDDCHFQPIFSPFYPPPWTPNDAIVAT